MITLKDNTARANAVKIIFYLMMGTDIISAYSNIMQHRLLKSASNGAVITAEMAAQNDNRQQIIGICMLFLFLGGLISFIMWFYRAYQNLHILKINTQFTPGWAIGAWFVPFINLGRPYAIMKEIWDETQEFVLPKEEKFLASSGTLVGLWWSFWLTNNIIGYASGRMSLSANTMDQLLSSTSFAIVSDVIDMAAMIITLIMVIKMSDYEKKLAEHVNHLNSLPPVADPVVTDVVPPVQSL